MGVRAPVFLATMLACSGIQAAERFALTYPGWTYYLGLHSTRAAAPASLRLDAPGRPFLSEKGLRLPLGDSAFLSLEATVLAHPAQPQTAGYALRAGVGIGMEF